MGTRRVGIFATVALAVAVVAGGCSTSAATVGPTGSTSPPAPAATPTPRVTAKPTARPTPAKGWIAYTSPDKTFMVDLPAKPTVATENVPDLGKLTTYESLVKGAGYIVFVMELPTELKTETPAQQRYVFDEFVKGLAKTATVTKNESAQFAGRIGREATIVAPSGTIVLRFCLDGQRIFAAATVSPKGQPAPATGYFFGSFAILH